MRLLDGKKLAEEIKLEIKAEVASLKEEFGVSPGLAVIRVGNDEASKIYIRHKQKACAEVGIRSYIKELDEDTSEFDLANHIHLFNKNEKVHGILVQLPLPKQIKEHHIIDRIHPTKDVDGFHPVNLGFLMAGRNHIVPCTPRAVIELLKRNNLEIAGKHCVIIGRSNIVGKPLAQLLLQENATVTICHSQTQKLGDICRLADILVSAVGQPNLVKANMVKPWAVVIDVGINRLPNGTIVGDVDFPAIKNNAAAITPVPGGVGPMTIAMLLKNTVKTARLQLQND